MGLYDDAVALANHRFVGRCNEISRFRAVLDSAEARLWWVFGPGGIGKTSLLSVLADDARDRGRRVISVDLRLADGSRSDLDAVADRIVGDGQEGTVVIIDAVEPSPTIEGWLRNRVLARLPSRSTVAVASRIAPSVEWRCDATWSTILEPVPLRGLAAAEGRQLLESCGLASESSAPLLELGRGHPLTLRLLADAVLQDPDGAVPASLVNAPDLVAAILTRMVSEVPSEHHRQTVELASITRVTTRSLIRDVCGAEHADHLFEWLATRPWIDRVPGGLYVHDLARDVVVADLRNNDPDRHAATFRAVRNHILDHDRVMQDPYRCAHDYLYLHRHHSAIREAWDWSSFGQTDTTPVQAGDRDVLADLVATCYGPASVKALDHWLSHQPQGFSVLRSAAGVTGFTLTLSFHEPAPEDLEADPSIAALWRRARVHGRPRAGETMGVFRFVCDEKEGTFPPSPTYNAVTVVATAYWLTCGSLSLDYIVKPCDGSFKPMMDYIQFHPVPDAQHCVGDREMVVFEHDWREAPLDIWLEHMATLERGRVPEIPVDAAPTLVALDESDFADAVRAALRDLSRPDRLVDNPLAASRVVRDTHSGDGPDAVVETVHQAYRALEDHARTDRARRAVNRTYLHGAATQEAAAEVLGMAFSTYRRHLATGVELLISQLWHWELYGRNDGESAEGRLEQQLNSYWSGR